MAAFDPATLDRWRELAIVDRNGSTVGTISEFYLDRETGYPTWALVTTGLFGATRTFVPLVHATEIGDGLQVPYEKRHIKDAPTVDLHDELTPDEEATLFAHYGVDYAPVPSTSDATQQAEDTDAVPDEPAPVEDPGPAPSQPGSVDDAGPVPSDPGSVQGLEPVPSEPGSEDRGAAPSEPGSVEGPGGIESEPESIEDHGPVESGPGAFEDPGSIESEPGVAEGPGPVRVEQGAAEADEVTQVAPGGFGPPGDHHEGQADSALSRAPDGYDPGPDESAPADPGPSETARDDPDLSRMAPVEPGLPGSTAASSSGPVPMTIEKGAGADPDGRPAEEPLRPPYETDWASGTAGSFEEPAPVERPTGASDRWREAKLAAERERIARAAAAQPEERSPLERARRRLERLVGGGQGHDPDDTSPDEREAAERARRARLGLDEDDPHRR
jgi:hypothetical protein